MDPFIVGIRFQKVGKVYHFDGSNVPDLRIGDYAVVETSRGRQLGEVVQIVQHPTPPPEGAWKPIQRKATPRDLVLRQIWQKKEIEAIVQCRARLAEQGGPIGVKIAAAEYSFDGSRLSFLYSTETEAKIDLRNLRNAMQRLYTRSHVEMRQIGPRDVAKLLGGMGACGLDNRCCSRFLTEFSPISIKMAKEQGISLTPSEITGMCGRLRCCLVYEYEQYVEARQQLPKRNKRVATPLGPGRVVDVYPLKDSLIVELDTGVQREFSHAEVQPWEELEALRLKAQEPCGALSGGVCTCGQHLGSKARAAGELDEEGSVSSQASQASALSQPAPKPPRPGQPPSQQTSKGGQQPGKLPVSGDWRRSGAPASGGRRPTRKQKRRK